MNYKEYYLNILKRENIKKEICWEYSYVYQYPYRELWNIALKIICKRYDGSYMTLMIYKRKHSDFSYKLLVDDRKIRFFNNDFKKAKETLAIWM